MNELKEYGKSNSITSFATLNISQEIIRIKNTTLDGKTHIQRIGKPAIVYNLRIFVTSEGRDKIYNAEDKAALLQVTVGSDKYYGRITERGEPVRISPRYYEMNLKLSGEEAP